MNKTPHHASMAGFDAAAYLARLDCNAPADASLASLTALLAAHMHAIPFENLDVLLGRTPRLDLASLQAKLVGARRGGYCFEHAALFGAALRHFGFAVQDRLARVVVERPLAQAGRTHHFLQVSLPEAEFVVDPGFGGLAPQVPVPLREGAEVTVAGIVHHWRHEGPWWTLCAEIPDAPESRPLWSTALETCYPPDFEMGNHFTATWPASPFRQRLSLRALTPFGRVSVLGREVTRREGVTVQRWPLADRAELQALLREHFGIELPEVLALRVPDIPEWD